LNTDTLHLKIKRAIEHEELREIKECIKNGADIHKCDGGFMCKTKGYTLLHWAIKVENAEILKYFLELGVDYKNVLPKEGNLLEFSSSVVSLDILDILLSLDFSYEAKEAFLQSAAFSAAIHGNSEKIEYLLDKGANINMQNQHGSSLLHYLSSFEKNFDVFELVLQRGIDINLKDNRGKTALDLAIKKRNEKLIHYLQQNGAKGDSADALSEIALFKAAKNGDIATITSYIESGGDIEVKNVDGDTLLWIAFENNHDALVKILIKAGANIHARTKHSNFTVTIMAAAMGDLKSIKFFLEHGADIHDYGGDNPDGALLIQACYYGHYETVKFLLEHGADINEVDGFDRTSLHLARYNEDDRMADLLLKYNPDLTIEDEWGTKAMEHKIKQ
jgi:uncharacterized protein